MSEYSAMAQYLIHPFCKGSKFRCCNKLRCEPCHFQHLKTHHSPEARSFILRNPGIRKELSSEKPTRKEEKLEKSINKLSINQLVILSKKIKEKELR